MIVKYVKDTYAGKQKNIHLKLNSNYVVVNINFSFYNQATTIGLCSISDGIPRLWDLGFFEIVNARIPADWVFSVFRNEYFSLEPQEFYDDFWEDFHDGKEEAEKIFENVFKKIQQFHR